MPKEVRRTTSPSLLLRLKRCWFDAIAGGYKVDEYRKATEYWRKRIEGKSYNSILFKNGYGQERPGMRVNYTGWSRQTVDGQEYYVLHLGPVLELENYSLPEQRPLPAQCEVIRTDPSQLTYHPELKLWVPLHRLPLEPALRAPALRPVSPLAVADRQRTEEVVVDIQEAGMYDCSSPIPVDTSVDPVPVKLELLDEVAVPVRCDERESTDCSCEEEQTAEDVPVGLRCDDELMVDLHTEW